MADCLKTASNFADKGRSNQALMLYGFGDGGGGPSFQMMERLRRLRDLDGLPLVSSGSPGQFFDSLEMDDGHKLCTWVGELYLELHNGTFTTQARVKAENRRCEMLLRDCEFLSALCWLQSKVSSS